MAAENAKAGKKRVTFNLHAPGAREVYLCGSFNNWDPTRTPMKSDGNGGWKAQVMLAPGEYQYRMRVDGIWTNDPSAECTPNEFGSTNCVRKVTAG
jgi:1,4-alpha-glucan branching enzyme